MHNIIGRVNQSSVPLMTYSLDCSETPISEFSINDDWLINFNKAITQKSVSGVLDATKVLINLDQGTTHSPNHREQYWNAMFSSASLPALPRPQSLTQFSELQIGECSNRDV